MALIGWAGGLLGAQVQFLQVAAGLDVAGADAGAEADAGDVQEQALGGFQIAAFEAGEKESSGGALFGQSDGGSVGGFLAGAGAADNDAGVAHIARGDEAVHEAAKDDHLESMAEEVFGGGNGDGRNVRVGVSSARRSILPYRGRRCCRAFFACFAVASRGEGRDACGDRGCRRALRCRVECDVGFGLVLLALLPEQSLGYAVGGEQALGEGAGCGKPGQGIGIQGREGFREVEALGLRDAPQLGDGGAAAEGVVEAEPLAPRDGVPA